MLQLNTNPTISRTQLLTEQLCGAIRDHEASLATLHKRGMGYISELLISGQRLLDTIHDADREQAEADGATGVYVQDVQQAVVYIKMHRLDIRAVADQLQEEGEEAQARTLLADYMTRQTRLDVDRPGDVRSLIEQYASANTKHRALLTEWGVDAAQLDEASAIAQRLPDSIDARRAESTEAELAVRTRNEAHKTFINAINPLIRRLNAQTGAHDKAAQAFASVINKFEADLTTDDEQA